MKKLIGVIVLAGMLGCATVQNKPPEPISAMQGSEEEINKVASEALWLLIDIGTGILGYNLLIK